MHCLSCNARGRHNPGRHRRKRRRPSSRNRSRRRSRSHRHGRKRRRPRPGSGGPRRGRHRALRSPHGHRRNRDRPCRSRADRRSRRHHRSCRSRRGAHTGRLRQHGRWRGNGSHRDRPSQRSRSSRSSHRRGSHRHRRHRDRRRRHRRRVGPERRSQLELGGARAQPRHGQVRLILQDGLRLGSLGRHIEHLVRRGQLELLLLRSGLGHRGGGHHRHLHPPLDVLQRHLHLPGGRGVGEGCRALGREGTPLLGGHQLRDRSEDLRRGEVLLQHQQEPGGGAHVHTATGFDQQLLTGVLEELLDDGVEPGHGVSGRELPRMQRGVC